MPILNVQPLLEEYRAAKAAGNDGQAEEIKERMLNLDVENIYFYDETLNALQLFLNEIKTPDEHEIAVNLIIHLCTQSFSEISEKLTLWMIDNKKDLLKQVIKHFPNYKIFLSQSFEIGIKVYNEDRWKAFVSSFKKLLLSDLLAQEDVDNCFFQLQKYRALYGHDEAYNRHINEIEEILRASDKINQQTINTINCFNFLNEHGLNEGVLIDFLNKGIDVNWLLRKAVQLSRYDIVKFLLAQKIHPVTNKNFVLASALSAYPAYDKELFNIAIDNEVPLDEAFSEDAGLGPGFLTPFMFAILQAQRIPENFELPEKLLNYGKDLNINYTNPLNVLSEMGESNSALTLAIRINHSKALIDKLLARNDIDVTLLNNLAIRIAFNNRDYGLCKKLYAKGARIPAVTYDKPSIWELYFSAKYQTFENASALQFMFDMGFQIIDGESFLISALQDNMIDDAKLLYEKGARISSGDSVQVFCINEFKKIIATDNADEVNLRIKMGINPNYLDGKYLEYAISKSCYNSLVALFEAGARPDKEKIENILTLAIEIGFISGFEYLITQLKMTLEEALSSSTLDRLLDTFCREGPSETIDFLLRYEEVRKKIATLNYKPLKEAMRCKQFHIADNIIKLIEEGSIQGKGVEEVEDIIAERNLQRKFQEGKGIDLFPDLPESEMIQFTAEGVPQSVKRAQTGQIVQGPKVKNQMTYDLEYIVKAILENYEGVQVSNLNSEYLITIGDKIFNLTEILKKADLTQLQLTKSFEAYVNFLNDKAQMKPRQPGLDDIADVTFLSERVKDTKLEGLHYAELAAINIYTQNDYTKLNGLLRGDSNRFANSEVKEILLHCVMASSGLSHIPDQTLEYTYRVESELPKSVLQTRIKSAKSSLDDPYIDDEMGFISASLEKPAENFTGTCRSIYYGISGKDISIISWKPEEREYLIPRTQIKWIDHKKILDVDYFVAAPVNSPIGLRAAQGMGYPVGAEQPLNEEALISEYFLHLIQLQNDAVIAGAGTETYVKLKLDQLKDIKETIEHLLKTDMPMMEKFSLIQGKANFFNMKGTQAIEITREKPLAGYIAESLEDYENNIQRLIKVENKMKENQVYQNYLPTMSNAIDAVNVLLQKPFGEEGKALFEDKYFQLCSDDWQLPLDGVTIQRPNHGLAHTLRTSYLVPLVAHYLTANNPDDSDFVFTESEIKKMQLASLFFVVGRKNELSPGDEGGEYVKFRQQSKEAFIQYSQAHPEEMKALFGADDFASTAEFKDYCTYIESGTPSETSKNRIRWVLYICHNLDLPRCRLKANIDEVKQYIKEQVISNETDLEALFEYGKELIKQTGDRLRGGEAYENTYYQSTLFKSCSTDSRFCLDTLSKVVPPFSSLSTERAAALQPQPAVLKTEKEKPLAVKKNINKMKNK